MRPDGEACIIDLGSGERPKNGDKALLRLVCHVFYVAMLDFRQYEASWLTSICLNPMVPQEVSLFLPRNWE